MSLNGRAHFVASMTLIVPGVLDGSNGPLYYSPEEIAKNVQAWNHIPIIVNHPTGYGTSTTARCAKVLDERGIGIILNSRIVNDKLVATAWIDIERCACVDSRVFGALSSNRQLELSTGLITDNEEAPAGATFNNIPYKYIARNYRPDHLAILPDSVGACSIQDGCGVLTNEQMDSRYENDGHYTINEKLNYKYGGVMMNQQQQFPDRGPGLGPIQELFESTEPQYNPSAPLPLPSDDDYFDVKPSASRPPAPTRRTNDRGPGLPIPEIDFSQR